MANASAEAQAQMLAVVGAVVEDILPALALNGPDLIRLYLSLQVLALLFVADLAPVLLTRLSPAPDPNTDPWHDPAQKHKMLHHVCNQVEAFGQLFDGIFGEEPAYIDAKDTARSLAVLV